MEDIYFITGNVNKLKEAQVIMPYLVQLNIDLPEIQSLDAQEVISAKLHEAKKNHKGPFIVEDTSFHMDCIGGLPGTFAKWFLASVGNKGLYDIAHKYNMYNAYFKVVIGYCSDEGHIHFFDGEMHGNVVAPQGDSGFGLDPIFVPDGYTHTCAQMSAQEKNVISHRSIAFQNLKIFLEKVH